jgi:hypothetical protein
MTLFVDNTQEGMKHKMRGETQAQQAMTLWITLVTTEIPYLLTSLVI